MRKSCLMFVLSVSILVLASGCSLKSRVNVDYDSKYNFSNLKTYAWISAGEKGKVSTLERQRQNAAIEAVLNQKGFVKVESDKNADFLLKTHTIVDKKVDVDRFYTTWGYHPFYYPHYYYPHGAWPHGSKTVVSERKVGTLVLDIVDPKKKQVIWQGAISNPLGIYSNRSPQQRNNATFKQMRALLAGFPPGPYNPPQK